jgi:two-component system LytT family response regulator
VSVKVLIVDDEAVARRRIRRLIALEPGDIAVTECADGRSAVRAIVNDNPDVVFLDVQMPELDGFEVAESIAPVGRPNLVFVTAFDRYAVRAFEVHAVDYLLKPFSRDRFRLALTRALDRHRRQAADGVVDAMLRDVREQRGYPSRIAVRLGDRFVVVHWKEIDWIEAADNYVKLHVGRKEYLLRETLTSIEARIDPRRFARTHRSTLVQIDRIAELRPATHGDADLVLRDGTRLVLTRRWRERVERLIRDEDGTPADPSGAARGNSPARAVVSRP